METTAFWNSGVNSGQALAINIRFASTPSSASGGQLCPVAHSQSAAPSSVSLRNLLSGNSL